MAFLPGLPPLLYGTAWKEDATASCVEQALAAGFRGIDTANQRKHYFEAGAGHALAAWFAGGGHRDALFLQTKFTYARGQDARLPYDPKAPFAAQVQQSFGSSLVHLGVERIDSLLLHGPALAEGLAPADREVWGAFEALHDAGQVRYLGVSNVALDQLSMLCDEARVAPAFVQNRCYANSGWDRDVRRFCDRNQIVYQGFSLLTANRHVLAHAGVRAIAAHRGVSAAEVVFRFALDVGMLPLTGTTDPAHMRADLAAATAPPLAPDERAVLEFVG